MESINPRIESLRPVESYDLFSAKNSIIIILCVLLLLSFLGINLLNISGNIVQTFANIFGPLVAQILSIFGYTTGTLINIGADVAGDTAKAGIDIAEGSLHSVGNILRDASDDHVNEQSKSGLDSALNQSKNKEQPQQPKPDSTENPIQNPIATNKSGWCLVGEYKGRRGCIEVSDQDKCLSGQVYPSQKLCLNPVLTPNVPYRPIPPQQPVYQPGAFFTGMYPPQPMPLPPQ